MPPELLMRLLEGRMVIGSEKVRVVFTVEMQHFHFLLFT